MLFLTDYHLKWSPHQLNLCGSYQIHCLDGGQKIHGKIGLQVALSRTFRMYAASYFCSFSSCHPSFKQLTASKELKTPQWSTWDCHYDHKIIVLASNAKMRRGDRGQRRLPVLGFASPNLTFSPIPEQKQDNEEDDFYLNVGYAIRTLREELPFLFYKELNFDIYRDDVTFHDSLMTITGLKNYRLLFWALRFHGRIFFKSLWIEIHRVWQPSEKVIMIRWTMRGVPRVLWEAQGYFDATSEYKLDNHGKIYEHKVTNVLPNSTRAYESPSILDLVGAVRGQTTPTLNFVERVIPSLRGISVYLVQFSWVRYYWALTATLAIYKDGDSFQSVVF